MHRSIEEQTFTSVEQYLALKRANLTGNTSSAARAIETQHPADHKVILNTLFHDRREDWIAQAPALITPAIRAKFSQNEDLADLFKDTHPLQIGEASKNPIWGLSLEDGRALHPKNWASNRNLLGNTLVQVRNELMHKHMDGPTANKRVSPVL